MMTDRGDRAPCVACDMSRQEAERLHRQSPMMVFWCGRECFNSWRNYQSEYMFQLKEEIGPGA